MTAKKNAVQDPARLNVLDSLQLLDTPAEAAFDRLTRLASKVIGAPVSLVSLVDADRQFFKSFVGLTDPWASRRETPLSHSFCQHVVASGEALVVADARKHPILKDNLAIPELGVIAYLGIPLQTSAGVNLGSFCVIDGEPRQWTNEEIEIVRELAMSVMTEIELRAQIRERHAAEAELKNQNRKMRRVHVFVEATINHMEQSLSRGAAAQEMYAYLKDARRELDEIER